MGDVSPREITAWQEMQDPFVEAVWGALSGDEYINREAEAREVAAEILRVEVDDLEVKEAIRKITLAFVVSIAEWMLKEEGYLGSKRGLGMVLTDMLSPPYILSNHPLMYYGPAGDEHMRNVLRQKRLDASGAILNEVVDTLATDWSNPNNLTKAYEHHPHPWPETEALVNEWDLADIRRLVEAFERYQFPHPEMEHYDYMSFLDAMALDIAMDIMRKQIAGRNSPTISEGEYRDHLVDNAVNVLTDFFADRYADIGRSLRFTDESDFDASVPIPDDWKTGASDPESAEEAERQRRIHEAIAAMGPETLEISDDDDEDDEDSLLQVYDHILTTPRTTDTDTLDALFEESVDLTRLDRTPPVSRKRQRPSPAMPDSISPESAVYRSQDKTARLSATPPSGDRPADSVYDSYYEHTRLYADQIPAAVSLVVDLTGPLAADDDSFRGGPSLKPGSSSGEPYGKYTEVIDLSDEDLGPQKLPTPGLGREHIHTVTTSWSGSPVDRPSAQDSIGLRQERQAAADLLAKRQKKAASTLEKIRASGAISTEWIKEMEYDMLQACGELIRMWINMSASDNTDKETSPQPGMYYEDGEYYEHKRACFLDHITTEYAEIETSLETVLRYVRWFLVLEYSVDIEDVNGSMNLGMTTEDAQIARDYIEEFAPEVHRDEEEEEEGSISDEEEEEEKERVDTDVAESERDEEYLQKEEEDEGELLDIQANAAREYLERKVKTEMKGTEKKRRTFLENAASVGVDEARLNAAKGYLEVDIEHKINNIAALKYRLERIKDGVITSTQQDYHRELTRLDKAEAALERDEEELASIYDLLGVEVSDVSDEEEDNSEENAEENAEEYDDEKEELSRIQSRYMATKKVLGVSDQNLPAFALHLYAHATDGVDKSSTTKSHNAADVVKQATGGSSWLQRIAKYYPPLSVVSEKLFPGENSGFFSLARKDATLTDVAWQILPFRISWGVLVELIHKSVNSRSARVEYTLYLRSFMEDWVIAFREDYPRISRAYQIPVLDGMPNFNSIREISRADPSKKIDYLKERNPFDSDSLYEWLDILFSIPRVASNMHDVEVHNSRYPSGATVEAIRKIESRSLGESIQKKRIIQSLPDLMVGFWRKRMLLEMLGNDFIWIDEIKVCEMFGIDPSNATHQSNALPDCWILNNEDENDTFTEYVMDHPRGAIHYGLRDVFSQMAWIYSILPETDKDPISTHMRSTLLMRIVVYYGGVELISDYIGTLVGSKYKERIIELHMAGDRDNLVRAMYSSMIRYFQKFIVKNQRNTSALKPTHDVEYRSLKRHYTVKRILQFYRKPLLKHFSTAFTSGHGVDLGGKSLKLDTNEKRLIYTLLHSGLAEYAGEETSHLDGRGSKRAFVRALLENETKKHRVRNQRDPIQSIFRKADMQRYRRMLNYIGRLLGKDSVKNLLGGSTRWIPVANTTRDPEALTRGMEMFKKKRMALSHERKKFFNDLRTGSTENPGLETLAKITNGYFLGWSGTVEAKFQNQYLLALAGLLRSILDVREILHSDLKYDAIENLAFYSSRLWSESTTRVEMLNRSVAENALASTDALSVKDIVASIMQTVATESIGLHAEMSQNGRVYTESAVRMHGVDIMVATKHYIDMNIPMFRVRVEWYIKERKKEDPSERRQTKVYKNIRALMFKQRRIRDRAPRNEQVLEDLEQLVLDSILPDAKERMKARKILQMQENEEEGEEEEGEEEVEDDGVEKEDQRHREDEDDYEEEDEEETGEE